MVTSTLIIAGIIVVLVILTLIGLMSRYRRCASDEILVVFGKAGKKSVTNPATGKSETVVLPSKIIHGGGTFVFPIIQDWKKMSLKPIQIQTSVVGVSSQMIKVSIPVTLTTGIGTTDELMQNAASRFLTARPDEISEQIRDILIGEMRSLMATMTMLILLMMQTTSEILVRKLLLRQKLRHLLTLLKRRRKETSRSQRLRRSVKLL